MQIILVIVVPLRSLAEFQCFFFFFVSLSAILNKVTFSFNSFFSFFIYTMFSFLRRTASVAADSTAKALRMDGLQGWQKELPMLSLKTKEDLMLGLLEVIRILVDFQKQHWILQQKMSDDSMAI
ncbi:unnamed protein product [Absidia cylindrospora]